MTIKEKPHHIMTGQRFTCNIESDDFVFVLDELSGLGNARVKSFHRGIQRGDTIFLRPESVRALRDKLNTLLHKMEELEDC